MSTNVELVNEYTGEFAHEEIRVPFYEFTIWNTIEFANSAVDGRWSVSECRVIRNEIMSTLVRGLKSRGIEVSYHTITVPAFLEAMNEVIGRVTDGQVEYTRDNIKADRAEFFSYVEGKMIEGQEVVPLSPYWNIFEGNSAGNVAGTDLMFISQDQLSRVNLSLAGFMRAMGARDARLRDTSVSLLTQYGKLREVPVMTSDDVSGLTYLAKYMTEREFEVASRHLSSVVDSGNFMSKEAFDRSVAILQYLQENGYEYEVTPDTLPGQIQARIKGTRIAVRLTEPKENERFVGRVYDNGAQIYFNTSMQKDGKNVTYDEVSVEDTVALLQFALGVPLEVDGEQVGRTGVASYQFRKKGESNLTTISHNMTYVTNSGNGSFVYKPLVINGRAFHGNHVNIYRKAPASASQSWANSKVPAINFLQEAVASARARFKAELGEDLVYQAYRDQLYAGVEKSEMVIPEELLTGDSLIAEIRKSYWDVLIGRSDLLLRPGVTIEDYNERKAEIFGGVAENFDDLVYHGDPEVVMQEHASDVVDAIIGTFQVDEDGKRFDLVNVARYMEGVDDIFGNQNNLVSACQELGIRAEDMRGQSFSHNILGNQLIYFDVDTARKMVDLESPFMRRMFNAIQSTLETRGCEVNPEDILIDGQGLVSYRAKQYSKRSAGNGDHHIIEGTIGQIFEPEGELGYIKTAFGATPNYLSAPGYEAYVLPQKAGEKKTVEERTRLRGYADLMEMTLRYELAKQVATGQEVSMEPASLNSVYARLYDTRHDLDFFDRSAEEGLSTEWANRIIRMEASRVKYPKSFVKEATINAEYQATHRANVNPRNDNFYSTFALVDGRNMAVLDENVDGYFDPLATGGATNQGTVRYLTEDVKVNEDGSLTPGDKESRAPLMADGLGMEYSKYDPADRVQMVQSNIMQASAIIDKVCVAQVPLDGLTFEDGNAVRKSWAEAHPVRDINGNMRSLIIGDKLCEGHGDKGVIPKVIDPDMDLLEAEALGIKETVLFFRNNPGVDIVSAPYPAVSRFNAGKAREMMDGDKIDIVLNDGTVVEAGASTLRMIITHMTVDNKTKIYDTEAVAEGRGRKASAQLAWGLNSHGAEAIMKELYGSNNNALIDLREHLIVLGFDIDEYGNFKSEYTPQEGEVREVFPEPELVLTEKGNLSKRAMVNEFKEVIQDKGGFMTIPFPLALRGDGADTVLTPQDENGNYLLPVLSANLRSGHELQDGQVNTHAYTSAYVTVFEASLEYRDALRKMEGASDVEKAKLETSMQKAVAKAESAYATMRSDIVSRKFEGKHNLFRDGLMMNKQQSSATAVWTADTNVGIDEVAMSSGMAAHLGVKPGEPIVLWRDPVLRAGGIRGFKVTINDELTGVAVHPAVVEAMSGDFDGDSVGLVAPKSKKAKREALEKLSVAGSLLDKAVKDPETGLYELNLHQGLDVQVARWKNPELDAKFVDIKRRINEYEQAYEATGKLPEGVKSLHEGRTKFVQELNGLYRQAFTESSCAIAISYKDPVTHLKSVYKACIETGAKGSVGKLREYMRYFGLSDGRTEGDIDFDNIVDHGKPLITREDQINTQYATAVKAFGTGVAGMFSQRGMSVLRNLAPTEVLELTYVATQSVLQAKHDPIEARRKYELLMGTMRHVWTGVKLEEHVDADGATFWEPVREKGKPVELSREEWVEQTTRIYHHKDGMNVEINPELIDSISKVMVDDQGYMMNIETSLRQATASPMDTLAYGGTMKDLENLASKGANVFEGKYNDLFKPSKVRENIEHRDLEQAVAEAKVYRREVDSSMYRKSSFVGRDMRDDKKVFVKASSAVKQWTPPVEPEVEDDDVDLDF